MERSRLRASTGMRYALLNPILEELAKEGKIRITSGKHEDLISLENARCASTRLQKISVRLTPDH